MPQPVLRRARPASRASTDSATTSRRTRSRSRTARTSIRARDTAPPFGSTSTSSRPEPGSSRSGASNAIPRTKTRSPSTSIRRGASITTATTRRATVTRSSADHTGRRMAPRRGHLGWHDQARIPRRRACRHGRGELLLGRGHVRSGGRLRAAQLVLGRRGRRCRVLYAGTHTCRDPAAGDSVTAFSHLGRHTPEPDLSCRIGRAVACVRS